MRRPDIAGLAAANGITVRRLADAEADWRQVLRAGAPHTTEYVPSLMAYFVSYNRDAHPGSHDLSLVIYHDDDAVRRLAVDPCDPMTDGMHCGSNMGPVLPPAFRPDLPPRVNKRLSRACFATVEQLCRRLAGQAHWEGRARCSTATASANGTGGSWKPARP